MRNTLQKITLTQVLILALFEFVTLFFISLFGVDTTAFNPLGNALGGIAVGFVGTVPIIILLNLLLGHFKVNFWGARLQNISVLAASVYNGVFLMVLFFIESFLTGLKSWNLILGNAIVGATTTPLSLLIVILLYNALPYKISYAKTAVTKIGVGVVITAAVYEAIALPLMALFGKGYLENPHMAFALTGLISGVIGGLVAMAIYNLFMKMTIFAETTHRNL